MSTKKPDMTDPNNPYFYTGYHMGTSSACDQLHAIAHVYGPCPAPEPEEPCIENDVYCHLRLSELEHRGGDQYVFIDRGYDNDGGDTYHYFTLTEKNGKPFLREDKKEFEAWPEWDGGWDE